MDENSRPNDVLNELANATPRPLSDAISSVLSFYGSEATSHASLAIGFVVAFLALIQVRGTLDVGALSIVVFVLAFGGVYSVFRIVYYGSLSTALMHGYLSRMEKLAKHHSQQIEKRTLHGFVMEYAHTYLIEALKIRGRLFRRARVPPIYSALLAMWISLNWFVLISGQVVVTWLYVLIILSTILCMSYSLYLITRKQQRILFC